ncbi:MAG TPA: hypothetical protein VMU14_06615 [Acidimicrobiales bacterium]|nr:hypothetical protein [Acidimicrobiales bacterium]
MRRWLRTTPGRLRAWSLAIVVALAAVGGVVAAAAHARGSAAQSVRSADAPELVASEGLYGVLADADATASIIYLKAGRESPALRQRYESDIQQAGQRLGDVAKDAGTTGPEHAAVEEIASHLPIYTGYVEAARANGRLGYPVGAAYLRQASSLMRDDLLPAAITVYEQGATRLDHAYRSGTSTTELALVVVAALVAVGLLAGVQALVARRSKRIINPGLAGATVVVLALFAWTLASLVSAQRSLGDAEHKGSDAVQVLSAARILTLEAQADDNTALIERGSGQSYVADFDSVVRRLRGPTTGGGLLAEARSVAARTGTERDVDRLSDELTAVVAEHTTVRSEDSSDNYTQAVSTATGTEAAAVTSLDADIQSQVATAQQRLYARAADAHAGFAALQVGIPVLAVLAGLLALVGIQRRIGEYA